MRIVIGSDHAGFDLKQTLLVHLEGLGHEVTDLGTYTYESVDYPDFGYAVGTDIASGAGDLGIAVCGSGIGICMAAGKVPGVRAGTVHDVTSARMARAHNDANVMCIGARFIGPQVAIDATEAFISTPFEAGRHSGRVEKINALD